MEPPKEVTELQTALVQRCLLTSQPQHQSHYVSQQGALVHWHLTVTPLSPSRQVSEMKFHLMTVTNSGQLLVKATPTILHQW